MTTWTRQLYEHDYLAIAKGESNGYSSRHIVGAVPAMSNGQEGSIWDVNDTMYPWSAFDTASVLNIPAVNAADNGHTLTISGLDADYNEITEVVTLSSAATVTTTNTFKRFIKAYYTNGGFNVTAAANINIRVGTTVVARVLEDFAETLSAMYTVPAGYTAYLCQGTMTLKSGADATGNFDYKLFGSTHFRTGHTFEVVGDGGQYLYEFKVPFALPEKTDVDVRALVRSNNSRITAAYDMILVANSHRDV